MSEEVEVEEPVVSGIGGGVGEDSATPEPLDFSAEGTYQQFVSSLPDDLREKNLIKETKSFQSLAEQALNAQSALGKKRLAAPQDDWSDNDWQDFYTSLRPETADGYTALEKHSVQLEGEDILRRIRYRGRNS